jgi:hypothetical protein
LAAQVGTLEVLGGGLGGRREQRAVALAATDGALHVLARAPLELHTLRGFTAAGGDGRRTSVSTLGGGR